MELDIDLVVLAGYLKLLPIVPEFAGRVINIHPALLPKHGGKGMYGDRVHEAVLASGDSESGCTVHLCNEGYDDGRILLQARVPVLAKDTVTTLAARFCRRARAYPAAIAMRWQELGLLLRPEEHGITVA
jgi:folate-dependent phosphoribosylglycinamide formyltransferase PurN